MKINNISSVATSNHYANLVGNEILNSGGNAFDAVVAVSFVLSVVEPYSSGIGGGGSLLYFNTHSQDSNYIDYRETCPLNSVQSNCNVGVPGFIKGMSFIHKKYCNLPWGNLIYPAIYLCNHGFYLNKIQKKKFGKNRHFNEVYTSNGRDLYTNKLLGTTLNNVALKGESLFYDGELSYQIMEKTEIKESDFSDYRISLRPSLRKNIKNIDVYTAALPSGGTFIIQVLYILFSILPKNLDYRVLFTYLRKVIKFVQYESLQTFGDISREKNEELISDDYLEYLRKRYIDHSTIKFSGISDSNNTTHIVVKDNEGNFVSVTNSISSIFGSKINVGGFYLNNQLKNFSNLKINPNNRAINRRPFSFVAPTIMISPKRFILNIGAAGGFRIPTILSYVLTLFLKYNIDLKTATEMPRFVEFNQRLYVENGFSRLINSEEVNNYINNDPYFWGSVQSIYSSKEFNMIVSDMRRFSN